MIEGEKYMAKNENFVIVSHKQPYLISAKNLQEAKEIFLKWHGNMSIDEAYSVKSTYEHSNIQHKQELGKLR